MHQWSLILVILPLLKYSIRFFYVLSILPVTCSPPLCAIFVFYEDRASILRKQCVVLQGTLTLGDLKNLQGERLREIRQEGMLQCSSIPNFFFYQSPIVDEYTCVSIVTQQPSNGKTLYGSQYRLTFLHQLCKMKNFTQQAKPSSNENSCLCMFQIYNRPMNFSRKVAARKERVTYTQIRV